MGFTGVLRVEEPWVSLHHLRRSRSRDRKKLRLRLVVWLLLWFGLVIQETFEARPFLF